VLVKYEKYVHFDNVVDCVLLDEVKRNVDKVEENMFDYNVIDKCVENLPKSVVPDVLLARNAVKRSREVGNHTISTYNYEYKFTRYGVSGDKVRTITGSAVDVDKRL